MNNALSVDNGASNVEDVVEILRPHNLRRHAVGDLATWPNLQVMSA